MIANKTTFNEEENPLSKLRNKLSPLFNLATMVVEWNNAQDKNFKSRILPFIIAEAEKCVENQEEIRNLLDKL